MTYMPVTSFRRPMDAVQMAHHAAAQPPSGDCVVNKWDVLRELGVARRRLGVSDRALCVLQALLSFHPGPDLGGDIAALIVFPSNASICERLNGMPCSTMRRHLGALVQAGLIARRDSPNGKRFARHGAQGRDAFGFDLSPLPRRFSEISAIAEDVRATQEAHDRLRQTISLMRRDLAGLAVYGAEVRPLPLWDRLDDLAQRTARALRRTLTLAELSTLAAPLAAALDEARDILEPATEDLSTSPRQTEQHRHRSDKDTCESEQDSETHRDIASAKPLEPAQETDPAIAHTRARHPRLPLGMVLKACPKLATYAPEDIRHWHQLVNAAETIRPMMGISPPVWRAAVEAMGREEAAIVVVAMLERFNQLRSPGGYLRVLTAKAASGTFSCGPMVMALLKRESAGV